MNANEMIFLIIVCVMALEAIKFHLFFNSLHVFIFIPLFTFENERSAVSISPLNVKSKQFPSGHLQVGSKISRRNTNSRQKRVMKCINSKGNATSEETVKAAEFSQKQTATIIQIHSPCS